MNLFYLNVKKSVKAIIYNSEGKILLQQRDNKKNLPLPLFWNFFGGSIEENETPKKALKRELFEELSISNVKIEKLFFKWESGNEWNKNIIFFYPVFIDINVNKINLQEGSDVKWFDLFQLMKLDCTPAIYENFSQICLFIFNKKNIKNLFFTFFENYFFLNKYKNKNLFFIKNKNYTLSKKNIFLFREFTKLKKKLFLKIQITKNINILIIKKNHKINVLNYGPTFYQIFDGNVIIENFNKKNKKKYFLNNFLENINNLTCVNFHSLSEQYISSKKDYSIIFQFDF